MTNEELAKLAELNSAMVRLRASHDRLLAVAKRIAGNDSHGASDWAVIDELKAAIAVAEEPAP